MSVYFSTYASERAVNHNHRVTFEYPFNRLKPYAGVSFLSTNDRPGYEIDARARHTESAYNAGAELRILTGRASPSAQHGRYSGLLETRRSRART